MSKKLSASWNKLSSKLDKAKEVTAQRAKELTENTKESITALSNKDNLSKCKDVVSQAATATGYYLKNSPELLKDFADETVSLTTKLTSKESIEKYKTAVSKAAADTWTHVRESPEVAAEKYKKMDKSHKVLALSAMIGGAVVSIPFIIALGPMSIVSALATLGLGSLAAGGYGVAGGLIVTGGGAVLAAALAGTVANKLIDDPEINELIENYGKLEEIIKQNFQTMENNQDKYKGLYEKYAVTADFVIQLKETIENGDEYDLEQVIDRNNRVKFIIEDLTAEFESESAQNGQ